MLPREAPESERPAEPVARPLTRIGIALALAGAALAITACGSNSDQPSPPAGEGSIELVLTLDADGDGGDAPATKRVSCTGAECPPEAAELTPADFVPVSPDAACTEIYGGPDVVTIDGAIDGQAVNARLTRANGCEIDRFDRFAPLLVSLFPGYEPGASLQP